ncbi:MAG: MazG nucleotide pyrophosphohydrolase domain-containing protein [Patescibacteria group bacterium]
MNDLIGEIMAQAERKGFGTNLKEINVAEKIALIHSEVSEAYEAYRRKNIDGKDGFKEELADIIIRVLNLAGVFEIDIEQEIKKKMEFNEKRVWDWDKLNETHK